jgi:Flp pilus assembly protein TadD
MNCSGGRTRPIAEYRTALGLDPASARATRALAFLLTSRGHYAEAETAFCRVVELAPRGSTAWFNLGFLCE